MKFKHVVFKLSSGGARQILRLISTGGTHLGNRSWDINTAVLPPSSWRLNSIRWHHLPLHHRLNISVQTTRPMLRLSYPPVNLPAPGSSIFIFIFSPDTAAELRASSRPLLSAQPATRSSPPAGGRNSRLSTSALLRRLPTSLGHAQVSPQQSFTRFPLRLLSLHRGSPSCSASIQPGL